jgi:cytosine deaminase
MNLAYGEAVKGYHKGNLPVGAALVRGDQLVSAAHNLKNERQDPTLHAEIRCIAAAGVLDDYIGTTLYTTLSPCIMCSGALIFFGISSVVIGDVENFVGDLSFLQSRGIDVRIHAHPESIDLMRKFLAAHPELAARLAAGHDAGVVTESAG